MKSVKRIFAMIVLLLVSATIFAAPKSVAEKKLVQTLEKNKKDGAEFTSEISLDGFKVSANGEITLSIFSGSAVKLTAEVDTTGLLSVCEKNSGKIPEFLGLILIDRNILREYNFSHENAKST